MGRMLLHLRMFLKTVCVVVGWGALNVLVRLCLSQTVCLRVNVDTWI